MKKLLIVILTVVLFNIVSFFPESSADSEGIKEREWPEELNIGVHFTEESAMTRVNGTFAKDLGEHLGMEVNLFNGKDYPSIIEAMRTGKVDLANFGPFDYIAAAERSGAVPFAVMARDEDSKFNNSTYIVHADSEAQTLEDLEGQDLLFVDPASTSGYLVPQAMIVKQLGIGPDDMEAYFNSVAFSGGDDTSLLAVANREVDVAAVSGDLVIDIFADSGLFGKEDIRVIAESYSIPSGPLSYRKNLPDDLVEEMIDFALSYDQVNPDYFESHNMTAYYPINDGDYEIIRDTADQLNMSLEQLQK